MPRTDKRPSWILQAGSGKTRTLPVHRNPGIEIVFLERGNLPWQVEGEFQPVGPASVFFTLPWQWHGSTAEFEPGHHWNYAIFQVSGERLERPGPWKLPAALGFTRSQEARIVRTLSETSRHVWPASAALAGAMRAIVRDYTVGGPYCAQRCAAWAVIVWSELEQTIRENRPFPSGMPRMERLLAELDRRLDEPWTLAAMAASCGLKRTQFTEMLRRHTGDTPTGLLNRLRVERARRMLREPSRSITEIAFACGFGSSQYFARVFRSLTGIPASAYRESRDKLPGKSQPGPCC
ncbi:MAG: AraC family transcriptional regulator [Chthoniobacteraceae bacterium]|nr:AraC family transcriptional regulator [Chthoniobacteraceae bacterium]